MPPVTDPVLNIAIGLPAKGGGDLLRSLHRQLRAAIVEGRLQPGLRLPPTRALAASLGVSRNTAIAAYDLLLSEGFVEARQGAGTYVADLGPRRKRPADKRPDPGLEQPPEPAPRRGADQRLAPLWRSWRPVDERCAGEAFRFDFVAGLPDPSFPFDIWQRLSTRAARLLSRARVGERDPAGEPVLRAAIARHVSYVRAVSCGPEDIVVTAGARQAIDLIARILVTAGRTEVALEDPGYAPTRHSFEAAGAKLLSVPVDAAGLVVERLPSSVRVVAVTPSHQFPLGVVLSAARRAALLDFAESVGAVVVEDDYDSEFRHDALPLDALQVLDRSGSVFYVGTFSKCMFPGLRLGFVVVPDWARYALTLAKQLNDWHCPLVAQLALADFISEGHLARHVRRMRRIYSERHGRLTAALGDHFDDRLTPLPAHAGVHLAARTRLAGGEEALVAAARTKGIRVEAIGRHARGEIAQRGLVFGFGLIQAGDIEPAVATLSKLAL